MTFEVSGITAAPWLPVAWGLLVGLVFSTVGAAGGILASVGLISVLGVGDANLVKPTAQVLTLVSPAVAVPAYLRQGRMVPVLALLLGAGGLAGALVGSAFSARYLGDLRVFRPVLGVFTVAVAFHLAWQIARPATVASAAARAAAVFECGGDGGRPAVRHLGASIRCVRVEFAGERFDFHPLAPFAAGALIAAVAAALGVGGGFLLVPFLSLGLGLPMTVIAGTTGLAILVSSSASVANYVRLGADLDLHLLALLALGTVAGSTLGPRVSRHLREAWLKGALALVLLAIGLRYLLAP